MVGAGGGGCDNGTGAGGYSSSSSDDDLSVIPANDGLTPLGLSYSSDYISSWNGNNVQYGGTGASYYQSGLVANYYGTRINGIPACGGQGGIGYGWFVGGCGGIAGKGGNISVNSAIIYAYNGDRFTTDDHSNTNSSYDASSLIKENGKVFVQAKNYAQSGVLRAVYCVTAKWGEKPNHNYSYFKNLFGDNCVITGDFTNPTTHDATYKNVCVREQENIVPLSYINPKTGNCQGIGSGFGYIELSNGTYSSN